jgi:hypothetical protein
MKGMAGKDGARWTGHAEMMRCGRSGSDTERTCSGSIFNDSDPLNGNDSDPLNA